MTTTANPIKTAIKRVNGLGNYEIIKITNNTRGYHRTVRILNFSIYLSRRTSSFTRRLIGTYPGNVSVCCRGINNGMFSTILPLLGASTHVPIYNLIDDCGTARLPPNPSHLPLLVTAILGGHVHLRKFVVTRSCNRHVRRFRGRVKR